MKYPDMYDLFQNEPEAKAYFESLPDYVKEQIGDRARGVNSFESLRHYAENLSRGDD